MNIEGRNILVAYFSATGQTKKLACTIAETVGGELFEIRPVQPYTQKDLDWQVKTSRSTLEMYDKHARPAIADQRQDMDRYDLVFLGFPIWWYDAPRIISTFLETYDFSGKTVIPFATSGGSGFGRIDGNLRQLCEADWKNGKRLPASAGEAAVRAWLDGLLP